METPKSKVTVAVEGVELPIDSKTAIRFAEDEVEKFDVVFQKLAYPAGTPLERIEKAAIAAYIMAKTTGAF